MGPKTLGSKYSREPFSNKAMKDEYFVYHSDCSRKDLAMSDDMTKDEKVASLLENARRQVSRKVVRAIQDNTNRSDAIEKLVFGSSRHGYSTDQDSDEDSEDSADSNPVAPPETYRYPQFNPFTRKALIRLFASLIMARVKCSRIIGTRFVCTLTTTRTTFKLLSILL
jgi:hypothetical protein